MIHKTHEDLLFGPGFGVGNMTLLLGSTTTTTLTLCHTNFKPIPNPDP